MRDESQPRAFDEVTDEQCPVCLELAKNGEIQPRAVMPLPTFPARLRQDGRRCCRDCQAAETVVQFGGHPMFGPSRLTVANERVEGLVMPAGMMEAMGLCQMGFIRPCSYEDLKPHQEWLAKHGIQDACDLGGWELEHDI